jgi:hypothetical protein
MRRSTRRADDLSEGARAEKRAATVAALVNLSLADGEYMEALIVAAANVIGIRSVTNSMAVEDMLGVIRSIAADAAEANMPPVLQ